MQYVNESQKEIRVQFIYHSSFLVELPEGYLLFDYYQGELPELDPEKPLYVFASHGHYDHFSTVIFQLIRKYPRTVYILSDDISERLCREAVQEMEIAPPEIRWISPGIEYTFPGFRVEAFGSTDLGVSFLIEAGGRVVFHAGDLNDWCWTHVPLSQNAKMQKDYLAELEKLKGAVLGVNRSPAAVGSDETSAEASGKPGQIDLAMIPMDPVLGKGQSQGPLEFLERIPVKHAFPMHMWERYSVGGEFLAEHPEYWGVFHPIRKDGERFVLKADGTFELEK